MTRDQAIARIRRLLAFRTDLEMEIQDALLDTQAELEREPVLPWFLRTEMSAITTTINEERIPVPEDFLQEWDDGTLWRFDSTATNVDDEWKRLGKTDLEFAYAQHPGTGEPRVYVLDYEYFRLRPVPDKEYTMKMIYYAEDTVLNSNIENKWLKEAHQFMIGVAGLKVASPVRDRDAFSEFQRMEAQGRARLYTKDQTRMHTNRRYVMGGED